MRRILILLSCTIAGVLAPLSALALDFSAGVSVGDVYVGRRNALAITPQVSASVRTDGGWLFGLQDRASILPATKRGDVGIYNHLVAAVGYAWKKADVRVGASLAQYSMPVCRYGRCAVVAGIGGGGDLQVNYFFLGGAGVSVSGTVDWLGGSSPLLPGELAVMAVAGPVIRW